LHFRQTLNKYPRTEEEYNGDVEGRKLNQKTKKPKNQKTKKPKKQKQNSKKKKIKKPKK
jgi:hypothetical protein